MIGLGATWELLIGFVVILILRYLNKSDPPAVLGIYQQPNKFFIFKFTFIYISITVRQWYQLYLRRKAVRTGKSDDGLLEVHDFDSELDRVQQLGTYPKAVDAVYFNGSSREGALMVCGCARRQESTCDAFLYLKTKDGDLLESPALPDTYLLQAHSELGKYKVAGLNVFPTIAMRVWKVKYDGEMKLHNDNTKRVNVKLNLTWSTKWDPFDYNFMSPYAMANAIAVEKWSKDYFRVLKSLHQNHYEQFGYLKGEAVIDGVEHKLEMDCVRDHSFGHYRDWRHFHRYALHFITMENNEFLAVGKVCMPAGFSDLTIGYYCRMVTVKPASFRTHPVTWCNLKLYEHGENKIPPNDYGFEVLADGKHFAVSVLVTDSPTFYIGKDREVKIHERFAKFEVNGVKGWGATEWQYRNVIK